MKTEILIEKLIELFKNVEKPLKLLEISKLLKIRSDSIDYELLKEALQTLIEQNVIEKGKKRTYYLKTDEFSEYTGKLEIIDGQGVIQTGLPNVPTIVIKRSQLNTALPGDFVVVRLLASKKKKKHRGEVLRILKRNDLAIVGKIEFDGYFYFLVPDEPAYYVDFLVPQKKLNGARDGDKVSARFIDWDDPTKSPKAEVIKILGIAGDPSVEYDSVIDEFQLPTEFPVEVLNEANQLKAPINRKPAGRLDFRKEIVITIDPEDAKDFDDALSLKKLPNGNYQLGVHIADVSYYVQENTAIDIEARKRATSIYLVDRVIPMLPEALSNEICSLKPSETRYTFSVIAELTPECDLVDYQIRETLIKSSRRFTYDEVQQIIDTKKGDFSELILELHKLTQKMKEKRYKQGGILFDTVEYKFVLDENKFPTQVKIKQTTPATSLVEECMLLANQIVALHIEKIKKDFGMKRPLPYLYRIHDEPDPKMLKTVLKFISSFGPKLNKKKITSKDINELLIKVQNSPEKNIINQVLIRSMPKAIYSDKNFGHYGLGFTHYTHFTSPIRRYPDLFVHRLLKEYAKGKPDSDRLNFLYRLSKDVARVSSDQERLAMEAERASNKVAFSLIANQHIGDDFDGIITGVTSFGLFVQLKDIYAEGLLHIKDMHDDYYIFDEPNYRLIGKRTKRIYKLGETIRVRIVKVNLEKRMIDLAYVSD